MEIVAGRLDHGVVGTASQRATSPLTQRRTRALEHVHAAGSRAESDEQREFLAAIADALRLE